MSARKRSYQRLAFFMSSRKESAIFRRFTRLNVLNLLSIQAELMELEEDLDIIWDLDNADPQREAFSASFNALRKARLVRTPGIGGTLPDECLEPRWEKMMAIRDKLKEYNETLLQVADINGLREPDQEEIETIRSWLERPEYGNDEIDGLESKAWSAPEAKWAAEELISLQSSSQQKAPFATWITGRLLTTFHERIGNKLKFFSRPENAEAGPGIRIYEETTLARNTRYLVMILASLLPIVCIVVLNAVESVGVRLGITAIFTAAFAMVLVLFTAAKEVEIFATTAAFAAVEVVFIGSSLSSMSSSSTKT